MGDTYININWVITTMVEWKTNQSKQSIKTVYFHSHSHNLEKGFVVHTKREVFDGLWVWSKWGHEIMISDGILILDAFF